MPRRQREETSQEREERLAIKRRRYHIRRQEMLGKETDIERQHRLSEEALRKRIIRGKSRATITKGIQGNMLNYGVEYVTVEGRRETLQQQEERVQKYKMKNDAIRKKNIRANAHAIETEEIRASRLHICAQQKAKNRLIIREMETNEQRSRRLHQQAEEQQISREKRSTYRLARTNTSRINVDLHHSGELNHECYTCGAVKFKHDGTKCCRKGKVHLPPLQEMPKIFYDLLTGYHPNSKEFKTHIRTYNSALAFVSFGANIEQFSTRGPYCFKIHGQVYHRMGSALPNPGEKPKYAQLYILDTEYATMERAQNPQNVECDSKLLKKLDEELRIVNPFAEALQMMHEAENDARLRNDAADIRMYFNRDRTDVDPHRYNAAFENGVAIIFVNPDGEPPFNRDICIHYRGGGLKNVPITHHSIDALTYPILLPCGDDGWSIGMKKAIEPGSFNTRRRENVSMLQYYSYRLATRKNKQENNLKFAFNPLLSAGKLTQQFIVDAYARVEANNLCFIRRNQKKLRSEMYDGLIDYVNHEAEHQGMNSGKLVILPSTFSGSTRALNQNYQDSIALIRRFGKADIFITFTCNTHWSEIKDNLEFGQSPEDRPDLVSRVFQTKLKSFFHDVLEDHIFGKPKAFTYTIEFQKRGLPHCHMLLILDQIDKIRNNNDIDEITSAEIPDPISDPELHDIVMKHMVHGPCGPRCQARNEKTGLMECTKGFPKKFIDSTVIKPNGYPEYRRRKGAQYKKGDMVVDNSMIVPYNPYLARKYGAHINVEQCFSVNSVKYIYKYIHKGHDRACIKITNQATTNLTATYNWDEVQAYIDARYISAPEAIWRLNSYKMHDNSHTVYRLPVHLPNKQMIYYEAGQEKQAIEVAKERQTMLTGWFELNKIDIQAHKYTYPEIAQHYRFDKTDTTWKRRETRTKVITRMYNVSPRDTERYYLRLLLLHRTGMTSFNDILFVNNKKCDNFHQAANELGLLADDAEWERTLEDAASFQMPTQLRQTFAFICIYGPPSNPLELWNKFKSQMSEDYNLHMPEIDGDNASLTYINDIFLANGTSCQAYQLPEPKLIEQHTTHDKILFDINEEIDEGKVKYAMLNTEQKCIIDTVLLAVENNNDNSTCINVDGPGGTGKTFVFNTIISILRGREVNVMAVAWTGIASLLLKGAHTVHSTFKLPLELTPESTSALRATSRQADIIRATKVILWDEISMTHTDALTAVDTILKEIRQDPRPFGGIIMVVGGDFRQQLPVVKRGSKTEILSKCVKSNILWKNFKTYNLTENMRLLPGEKEWSNYLLDIGNGLRMNTNQTLDENIVCLPEECIARSDLIDEVFGQTIDPKHMDQILDKAILAPKNEDTLKLNEKVLARMYGNLHTYISVDTLETDDENDIRDFPIEFLNHLTPTGMPPHKLNIKERSIIILLRNMHPTSGLCNGTRLQVIQATNRILYAEIITGTFKGTRVLIPKINLTPSDSQIPFSRRQFPVRLAFSMTISKSQGQSLKSVGIYLPSPVFTHGQLYVALSRCTSMNGVKISIEDTAKQGALLKNEKIFTPNIVYKEALTA